MSSRSQRRMQMKNAHITAIVVGIFLILGGLYFILVISGQTDAKNAKCTEKTVGTITYVSKSDSKYNVTIDYEIEGSAKTMTVKSKKDLGVGNTIDIYYEPLHFSHLYIEGITETGKTNIISGIIMIVIGAVFIAAGVALKKSKGSSLKPSEN